MRIHFALLSLVLLLCLFVAKEEEVCAQTIWEGFAIQGNIELFPARGQWALSNDFAIGTIVEITDVVNGRKITARVIGGNVDPNYLILLSPEAAQNLGIGGGYAVQARLTPIGEAARSLDDATLDGRAPPLLFSPDTLGTDATPVTPPISQPTPTTSAAQANQDQTSAGDATSATERGNAITPRRRGGNEDAANSTRVEVPLIGGRRRSGGADTSTQTQTGTQTPSQTLTPPTTTSPTTTSPLSSAVSPLNPPISSSTGQLAAGEGARPNAIGGPLLPTPKSNFPLSQPREGRAPRDNTETREANSALSLPTIRNTPAEAIKGNSLPRVPNSASALASTPSSASPLPLPSISDAARASDFPRISTTAQSGLSVPAISEDAPIVTEPLPRISTSPPLPIPRSPSSSVPLPTVTAPSTTSPTAPTDTSALSSSPSPSTLIRVEETAERPAPPFLLPQKTERQINRASSYIQIGAFRDLGTAEEISANLEQRGYDIFVYSKNGARTPLNRVLVGPIPPDETGSLLIWIRSQGFEDAFIKQGREL